MTDPEAVNVGRRFLGYVLVAAGGLLTLLSGACTLTWLGLIVTSVAKSPGSPPEGVVPGILIALPFGGLPIAIGVGLIIGGRSILKRPKPPLNVA